MATKKKMDKPATKTAETKEKAATNGNALWKLKGDERAVEITKRYPNIAKSLGTVASAFEIVTPNDARTVSAFVRSRVSSFSAERLKEREAFNKEKKLSRLEAKAEKAKKVLAELEELRAEFA